MMETLENVLDKSNEYSIPKKSYLIMYQLFLALEKLINDSLMDLLMM
jgi:hypothetical protein